MVRATRFDVTRIALHGLLSLAASLGLLHPDAMANTEAADAAAPRKAAPNDHSANDTPLTDDIIVTAKRYGDARVKAESEFSEDEIATFGADDVQQLLDQLSPFIDPGGEEPVILIDGQPAGFDTSILSYPAEALERLAVLAPEAAVEYGHPSGKRVVNLVLKKSFSSLHADAGLNFATGGGQYGGDMSAGRLLIQRPTRWNVQGRVSLDSALRKSARNIPRPEGPFDRVGYISSLDGAEIDPALSLAAGETVTHAAIPSAALTGTPTLEDFAATANQLNPVDPNGYDTLRPSRRSMSLNLGGTRPVGAFSASFSLNANNNESRGQRGLPMASFLLPANSPWSPFENDVLLTRPLAGDQTLRNENNSKSLGLTLTLSGRIGDWQTNLSASYRRNWSNNLLEQGVDAARVQALLDAEDPNFNPYGPWDERYLLSSRNRSRGENLGARLNVSRKVLELPAGPMTTSLSLNASRSQTRSQGNDSLNGPTSPRSTAHEQADGQLSFNLPLSRRVEAERSLLGDLSLTLSMGGQAASNSPLQKQYGGDLTWSPFPMLQLRGSLQHMEMVPALEMLDAPLTSTISRIYDYSRQEMVDLVWITGGNPDLERGRLQNLSVNAMVRPLKTQNLTLNFGYTQRKAKGGIAMFPELTPAVEAAFPERVTRDAQGRLISVDARPINIAHDTDASLSSGITLRWRPGQSASKNKEAGENTGSVRPANPVLVTASINHRMRLKSELLTRPGIPPIDRLGPDNGQPRHTVSFQSTVGKRGLGASLNANWTAGARLRGTTPEGDFHFKPSTTYNLSMHMEPRHVFPSLSDAGWAQHLKFTLNVQNLFNSYRRVTFSDGSIPPGYSRDEIDPLGRTIRLNVRKRF